MHSVPLLSIAGRVHIGMRIRNFHGDVRGRAFREVPPAIMA